MLPFIMSTRDVRIKVKEAIMRLKKKNNNIRVFGQTLGLPKSTVWNIIKNKERTGEFTKGLVGQERTLHLMTKESSQWYRKIPKCLSDRSETAFSKQVCVCQRLHEQKYRDYTARCKPLISQKNRKARLQFAQK